MPSEAVRNMVKEMEILDKFLHVPTQLQLSFNQKKFGWEKFAAFSNLFFNNKFKAKTEKQSVMDITESGDL